MKQVIAFVLIGSAGLMSAVTMANGQPAQADIALAQVATVVVPADLVADAD
jgi:hypothetical protein